MRIPPLIDLHEDISTYYVMGAGEQGFPVADFREDVGRRHGDIPKYRRANLRLVFASVFPMLSTLNWRLSAQLTKGYQRSKYRPYSPRAASTTAFEHIKAYYALAAEDHRDLLVVRGREDIATCFRSRRTGLLLSLEGAEALEDTSDISIFYNLGLRALGLTWNYDTRYSATCMSKWDYGLTGEGHILLEEMNRLGIIVDLAHASRKTDFTILEESKLPVFVTHANSAAVWAHARNLDDEFLERLKEKRGVFGLVFAPVMIGGKRNLEELVRHVMHVYTRFGSGILAVGSDFFGLGSRAPHGLEDITKVGQLWDALLDKGMKESDIERISYKNALRVIDANARRWKPFA